MTEVKVKTPLPKDLGGGYEFEGGKGPWTKTREIRYQRCSNGAKTVSNRSGISFLIDIILQKSAQLLYSSENDQIENLEEKLYRFLLCYLLLSYK